MSAGDSLSLVHFLAVASEIEGRFFTSDEADRLKREIDDHTFDDPQVRLMAASCWTALLSQGGNDE